MKAEEIQVSYDCDGDDPNGKYVRVLLTRSNMLELAQRLTELANSGRIGNDVTFFEPESSSESSTGEGCIELALPEHIRENLRRITFGDEWFRSLFAWTRSVKEWCRANNVVQI